VRLHDLRHAWATTMIGNGADVATVSEALGHATIAFTLDTYVTPNREMAERLAAAAEAALGNARESLMRTERAGSAPPCGKGRTRLFLPLRRQSEGICSAGANLRQLAHRISQR
jgi:integrase-like protein